MLSVVHYYTQYSNTSGNLKKYSKIKKMGIEIEIQDEKIPIIEETKDPAIYYEVYPDKKYLHRYGKKYLVIQKKQKGLTNVSDMRK